MKIAIIGAGNVGTELARGWAAAGHRILFGVRDPNKPEVLALCKTLGAAAYLPADAAAAADVVVIALPWTATESVLRSFGDLEGKTVIDCTNPLKFEDGRLSLDRGFDTSGGECVAALLDNARVVKTLNSIGANLMSAAHTLDGTPVMYMAGDDEAAKAEARALVEALGFEAIDSGGIVQSRLLEPLAMLWINQALVQGQGYDWALGILRLRAD